MTKAGQDSPMALHNGPLLVVAGIPAAMASIFGQRVSQAVNPVLWMPLGRDERGYTVQYVAEMYERFADRIRMLIANGRVPTCMLAFVTHDGTEQVLVEKFRQEIFVFPFAEKSSVTFQVKPAAHVREHVNKVMGTLVKCSRLARKALQAIEKEIKSAANRTPLLLPPVNFSADKVRWLLDRIRDSTLKADNPFDAVKHEVDEFCKIFPRRSFSRDKKKHFVNERGIVFRAGARHGAFRPDFLGNHDAPCFPRSRLRLGASYEPSFHYDCCTVNSRKLPTSWAGCHQQSVSVEGSNGYVNIYPNDYVR